MIAFDFIFFTPIILRHDLKAMNYNKTGDNRDPVMLMIEALLPQDCV